MYSEIERELAEKDSIIENLQHKLDNVQALVAEWRGYCLENGWQTMRLMSEVLDVVEGRPVMAGTRVIQ